MIYHLFFILIPRIDFGNFDYMDHLDYCHVCILPNLTALLKNLNMYLNQFSHFIDAILM